MSIKRNLKIVFMGTPDFAVAILEALLNSNYEVVGVITAPDKPAGRGQKLSASAVKQYALLKNLNVLQPTNLKSEDFLETLQQLQANLQIVVAFRMLPKVVWQMPEYGTFNLHASLLPQYRGAAPIHWAIINGEKETGVTTFFIDEKIDTGAIILKAKLKINATTTVGELHDNLMLLGCEAVIKTVKRIEANTVKTVVQSQSLDLKTAYKLNKDNCKIDWAAELDSIYNKIRGLNPFPAAWCYLDNKDKALLTVKLFAIEKVMEAHNYDAGLLVKTKSELKVACQKGFIIINEIQLPGKRKMSTKALLNGFQFNEGSKML